MLAAALDAAPARRSPGAAGPRQERRDLGGLLASGHAWDELAGAALRPTPFFARSVVAAHAAHGYAAGTEAITVADGGRLLALLPYRRGGARFGGAGRAHVAWSSPFTPSADPLLRTDRLGMAVSGLLDGFATLPGLWLLPRLSLDGPGGVEILGQVARRGWPHRILDSFGRPVLARRPDWAAYLAAIGPRRAREMERRRRRMATQGVVALRTVTAGPALTEAVETFLRLERAGWKGRRGSAMASQGRTRALALDLFAGNPDPGAAPRADILLLDGRPVAASLALVAGDTAFMIKSAYDEAAGRLSPGIVLEEEILRACHGQGFAARLNSVAAEGSHLDGIYPDRERVGDLVLATPGGPSAAMLDRAVAIEEARRAWLRRAKDWGWAARDLVGGLLARPTPGVTDP